FLLSATPTTSVLLSSALPTPRPLSPPSLPDALPIFPDRGPRVRDRAGGAHPADLQPGAQACERHPGRGRPGLHVRRAADRVAVPDRKSTRLNSSHVKISYAVFCLEEKKEPGAARDVE